jgi:hypothetical protein
MFRLFVLWVQIFSSKFSFQKSSVFYSSLLWVPIFQKHILLLVFTSHNLTKKCESPYLDRASDCLTLRNRRRTLTLIIFNVFGTGMVGGSHIPRRMARYFELLNNTIVMTAWFLQALRSVNEFHGSSFSDSYEGDFLITIGSVADKWSMGTVVKINTVCNRVHGRIYLVSISQRGQKLWHSHGGAVTSMIMWDATLRTVNDTYQRLCGLSWGLMLVLRTTGKAVAM